MRGTSLVIPGLFRRTSTALLVGAVTLLLAAEASARTWYVDQASSYVASGTCSATDGDATHKLKRIQEAALCANPGDTVEISTGTYRETVRPARSGSSGSPITFQPASGATVTVSGANLVTGWALSGSNYRAALDCTPGGLLGPGMNSAYKDGVMISEARWPDDTANDPVMFVKNGYLANSSQTYFSWAHTVEQTGVTDPPGKPSPSDPAYMDSSLANAPSGTYDFTTNGNPRVWVNGVGPDFGGGLYGHYLSYVGTVVGWNGSTYKATVAAGWPVGGLGYAPGPYYLVGTVPLLNRTDEWVVKDGYLYLNHNPSSETIEFRCRKLAFDLTNRSWITVRKNSGTSLQIFAAGIVIKGPEGASNNLLDSLKINYPDYTLGSRFWTEMGRGGVVLFGNKNTIKNSTLNGASGFGIHVRGYGNTVQNNLVQNTGFSGHGMPGGIFLWNSTNHLVTQNTVRRSAYAGVYVAIAHGGRISYNDIFDGMLLTSDGGGIYVVVSDVSNMEIDHNRLHDNAGNGIFTWSSNGLYLDVGTENLTAHHNVSWNNATGTIHGADLQLGKPKNSLLFYNNTVLKALDSTGAPGQFNSPGSTLLGDRYYASRFVNNIFVDVTSFPYSSAYDSPFASNNFFGNPSFVNQGANDFHLQSGSAAKNAGVNLVEVTDRSSAGTDYCGTAPDEGAYETAEGGCTPVGASANWDAGCRSPNIDTSTCTASITPQNVSAAATGWRNLLKNAGFETEFWIYLPALEQTLPALPSTSPLEPWYVFSGSAVRALDYSGLFWAVESHMLAGIGSLRFGTGAGEVRQVVPVTASSAYTLRAWVKVLAASGQSATVAITAGAATQSSTVDGSSTNCVEPATAPCWKKVELSITPAGGVTSATVKLSATAGSNFVYMDELALSSSANDGLGTAPGSFSLSSPANGATGVAATPTLSWGSSSGATTYQVTVDDNADFSSPTVNANVTGTSYAVPSGLLCRTTLYSWKVTAFNSTSGEGTATSTRTFTTGTWTNPATGFCSYRASDGYSSTQGTHQWRYQYAAVGSASYSDLTYDSPSGWWRLGGAFPLVGSGWMHPSLTNDAVLTWVAPADGTVTLTSDGNVVAGSQSVDGVDVMILKGEASGENPTTSTIWAATLSPGASIAQPARTVTVTVGETIRFRANARAEMSSDSVNWNPKVAFTPAVSDVEGTDFGSLQHEKRWRYDYKPPGGSLSELGFYDLGIGSWRFAANDYPIVGSAWLHPGDPNDAVILWVAPADGWVTITSVGNIVVSSTQSDGVDVSIWKSSQGNDVSDTPVQLWSQTVLGGGSVAQPTLEVGLAAGQQILFRANKRANANFDSTNWNPKVVFRPSVSYISSETFSNVQKANQWRYEWATDTSTTYSELAYFDTANSWWRYAAGGYPIIAAGWMHPGSPQDASFTWVAPSDGTVTIRTTLLTVSSGGDGVKVSILKNGQALASPIWSATVAAGGSAVQPARTVDVVAGDRIHFRVNRNGNEFFDTTNWSPGLLFVPAS